MALMTTTNPAVMTSRQRLLAALTYTQPDKIPVIYQPSPAGLHVHGEKLARLLADNPPDNAWAQPPVPAPPAAAVDAAGDYHEFKVDDWGTEWEYRIFGVAGHPHRYALKAWDDPDFQFPALPGGCCGHNRSPAAVAQEKQQYLVIRGWVSIFEKLHALRPMDELMMDLAAGDRSLLAFIARLVDWQAQVVDFWLDHGADIIQFGDDWGTQESTLVSPAMFRRVFAPQYRRLFSQVKARGARVAFHSCGQVSALLEDFLGLGADIFWVQCECHDFLDLTARFRDRRATWLYHPDRQGLVPRGTPAAIREQIGRVCDRFHALGGGGIFNVEIENDAPFDNVEALITSIQVLR